MVLLIAVPIALIIVAAVIIRWLIRTFSTEQSKKREHELALARAGVTDTQRNKNPHLPHGKHFRPGQGSETSHGSNGR